MTTRPGSPGRRPRTVTGARSIAGTLGPGERLDRRISVGADGEITIETGKVELGQGIHNALRLLVAEELDVGVDQVHVSPVETSRSPDEGTTSASRSLEESGVALRHAAAEMRSSLVAAAAASLATPPEQLVVGGGCVSDARGRSVTFADLAAAVADAVVSGEARVKPPARRVLLGSTVRRDDLERKLTGRPAFVQDVELPGMLHGRIVRPARYGARLARVDDATLRALPGVVSVVRDGSFLGVIAEREEQAVAALTRARLTTEWVDAGRPPDVGNPRYLLDMPAEEAVVHARAAEARPAVQTLDAEYSRQFVAHAAVAPSCAVARRDEDGYTVWTHSQDVFALRHELAKVIGVAPAEIRVNHVEGAGCYGHNGADDVALDATLLARAVPGRPVRVQWMRDDEFVWEPFGPAGLVRLHGGLDAAGNIVDWVHHGWTHSHDGRPTPDHPKRESALLAAQHLARPFREARRERPETPWDGGRRNAVPPYDFAHQLVVDHFVAGPPLRVSALRSLGAHLNVFAAESFVDELAALGGVDPVALRLRHLEDPRARDVIEAVVSLAHWKPGQKLPGERGRGLGFARYKNRAAYAAVIVEVELDTEVRVRRAWGAIDAGTVVSRDGLLNQLEGGITQAVSWTLHEAVITDPSGVATRGWDTYRTLRFPEAPEIHGVLIDRPDEPPLGAGEAMTGPTAGAIANAVFNAMGIRVRDMPLTRERVIAAMP